MPRSPEAYSEEYQAGFEEAMERIFNAIHGLLKAIEDAAGEDLDPLLTAQHADKPTPMELTDTLIEFEKWEEFFDDQETKKFIRMHFITPLRKRVLSLQPFIVKLPQIIKKEVKPPWTGDRPPPGILPMLEYPPVAVPPEEPDEEDEE